MILSVDDGCASDMRVAELARRYKIETIFYWPVEWHSLAYDNGYEPLNFLQAQVIAAHFEIGAHTVTHRHLTKLSFEEAKKEIIDSKEMLEKLFGKTIKKFCPPRGYTTEELTERTLVHYESQRLTKGKGLVHIHPNSGANNNMDWRLFALAQDEVKELWCHSWELDKFDLWDQLEEYLAEHAA
jgi:peptidoglycan/xylan/chitin deacetylase (PgdA/CDA1 family)